MLSGRSAAFSVCPCHALVVPRRVWVAVALPSPHAPARRSAPAPLDTPPLSQVLISKEYLQLEPIGLVFVFFFALILVIQFSAMLFHRFGTLSHILASAELSLCWNKKVRSGNPN